MTKDQLTEEIARLDREIEIDSLVLLDAQVGGFDKSVVAFIAAKRDEHVSKRRALLVRLSAAA